MAADTSGLLLLLIPPPLSERDGGEPRTDASGVECSSHTSGVPRPYCVVCDVVSATASPIPHHQDVLFNSHLGVLFKNDLGVIAAPGGGGRFMVAKFHHTVGSRKATLLLFSSESGQWAKKEVANPLPHWNWTFSDVVSHGGKLWWVDRGTGLLACDPFADDPAMEYVELPDGDVQHWGGCGYCSESELGTPRIVQISNGMFWCVEMGCASQEKDTPMVCMWALADPGSSEWTREHKSSLSEIWARYTCNAAGLPQKAGIPAFIHPTNADIVYFFLEEVLIGVDMRAREVVECQPLEQAKRQRKCSLSSGLVFPVQFPSVVSRDIILPLGASTEDANHLPAAEPEPGNEHPSARHDQTNGKLLQASVPAPATDPKAPAPEIQVLGQRACFICGRNHLGKSACPKCLQRINRQLGEVKDSSSLWPNSFCFLCGFECKADAKCEAIRVSLQSVKRELFAWISKDAVWSPLFAGVQIDRAYTSGGRVTTVRIYPPPGDHCRVCKDWLGHRSMYWAPVYCSIECFLIEEPIPPDWAVELVDTRFSSDDDHEYCLSCAKPLSKAEAREHGTHDHERVLVQHLAQICVQVERTHRVASLFEKVKVLLDDPSESSLLFPIRAHSGVRCRVCRICLVDGGGCTCSLTCALSVALLVPRVRLLLGK